MHTRGKIFGLLAIAAVIASYLAAEAAQALPVIRNHSTITRPVLGISKTTFILGNWEGVVAVTTVCGPDTLKATLAATKEGQASSLSGTSLAASSCSVETTAGEKLPACSVRDSHNKKAGFIETEKLAGKFVWLKEKAPAKESEEEAGVVFWPEAEGSSPTGKSPVLTTEITGSECSVAGTSTFKGSMVAKVASPAVGSFASTMKLEFPEKPISTYYGGEATRTKFSSALRIGEQAAPMWSIEEASLESKESFGVFRE